MGLTKKKPALPEGGTAVCDEVPLGETLRDAYFNMSSGEFLHAKTKRGTVTALYSTTENKTSKSERANVKQYLRAALTDALSEHDADEIIQRHLEHDEGPISRADFRFIVIDVNAKLPSEGVEFDKTLESLQVDRMFREGEVVYSDESHQWIHFPRTQDNVQLSREGADVQFELLSAVCHHNLQFVLYEEVETATSEKAAATTSEIRELYELVPKDVRRHENYEELRDARATLSSTVRGGDEAVEARRRFDAAEDKIIELADPDYRLSVKDVLEINRLLTEGLSNNGGQAGQFRDHMASASGGAGVYPYLHPEQIEEAVEETLVWINAQLDEGQMDPIEIAALANQRIVSIHPFADGNGRTARMIMDLILLSHGLPPATLPNENTGAFGSKSQPQTGKTTEVVENVRRGVERSAEILQLK